MEQNIYAIYQRLIFVCRKFQANKKYNKNCINNSAVVKWIRFKVHPQAEYVCWKILLKMTDLNENCAPIKKDGGLDSIENAGNV